MQKNKLTVLVVTFFVLSFSMQNSYSAPLIKTGLICKTNKEVKTYQGKKFTCIKSGKKYVWSKGIKAPTYVPQIELFTKWSAKFNTKVMFKSALDSTNNYFGIVEPNSLYELNIDKRLRESERLWITQMLDYVNGLFKNTKKEKVRAFVGDRSWSLETLRKENLWIGNPSDQYPCQYSSGCAEKNLILLVVGNFQYGLSIASRALPAHEYFHTVQYSLSEVGVNIEPWNPRGIPRWLNEGSATYFGHYVVDKLGFEPYENIRSTQVGLSEYRTNKPLSEYNNYASNPYGIGQAATEYIVASVGFESLLNIFKYTNTEGTFSAGFKKATGLELSEFYSKFEDARSSMLIGY
jgi:hypothetical protein